MSLGEGDTAALRALAHPVRLQIMSLLTGASLTAAEVARELGITHANASYHLRNLLAADRIVVAGEEKIRGGVAKRYRYVGQHPRGTVAAEEKRELFPVVATDLQRRAAAARWPGVDLMGDAEVWVDPGKWREIRDRIAAALHDLHQAAQPSRTPGTVRTSTTIALFEMDDPS
ncbi:ArsR/SmtB family transcription factor [Actinoplanes rectilineatus]|uniref:ArsR/SmtB family transcription factor n=1 Tax=Actinoplanes rectilineatus TaxID=113571 RepID=UPI0005F2D45A|nr:helix-turn-helix domain-containing protein [Actinoplanes rectilineatus]